MTRILLILLASILLLAGCAPASYACTDPLGCLRIAPDAPIVIGVLAALSGEHASAGSEMLTAVQSAVEETGPILSHEVELIWEATDCSEASARLAAARLVLTPDLVAVIGPSCPADAPFSAPVLEDAGIAVLAPSSSGSDAFRRLAEAIQKVAVSGNDGSLSVPRSALQDAIKYQP